MPAEELVRYRNRPLSSTGWAIKRDRKRAPARKAASAEEEAATAPSKVERLQID